jgi:regulator of protease activity HflC (stomatin/prohibitin superfamily)
MNSILLGIFDTFFWAILLILILAVLGIRMVQQYETAVRFRLGKYHDTLQPGISIVIPIVDRIVKVDMRVLTIDIPSQQVITKDNVPVRINGVVYFKVVDASKAIIKVQDYIYAVSQYAQTALRDVVGSMSLDQTLSERESIGKDIEKIVESASLEWGIEVTDIKLQDIDMAEDLKRLMSRQASSEREKRANIIKSEGDYIAAQNLAKASKIMAEAPGAMQLRTLQTIDGLGPTASNTVVLAVPMDMMEFIHNMNRIVGKKK